MQWNSESRSSRKLGFRLTQFSETGLPPSACRAQKGRGLIMGSGPSFFLAYLELVVLLLLLFLVFLHFHTTTRDGSEHQP
jgi:hypothetical protein